MGEVTVNSVSTKKVAFHIQRPCGRTEVVMVGDSDAREDRADRERCTAEGALGFLLVRWK